MSNETDLDWLARNVHVWKSGYDLAVVQRGIEEIYVTWPSACSSGITKKEWLSRRAELQNKPSWDDFGESAKFMAQDSDGAWMAFESEPAANYHVWSSMRGWCGYAREGRDRCRGEVLGDWRDTLEKRPEQKEFEAFISIEDNQVQVLTQQQDNGWFERWELPPVGTACEAFGKFPTAPCEIIAYSPEQVAIRWLDNGLLDVIDLKTGDIPSIDFRPIRTEREVLIEIIKKTDDTDDRIADAILAAGFKRGAA